MSCWSWPFTETFVPPSQEGQIKFGIDWQNSSRKMFENLAKLLQKDVWKSCLKIHTRAGADNPLGSKFWTSLNINHHSLWSFALSFSHSITFSFNNLHCIDAWGTKFDLAIKWVRSTYGHHLYKLCSQWYCMLNSNIRLLFLKEDFYHTCTLRSFWSCHLDHYINFSPHFQWIIHTEISFID